MSLNKDQTSFKATSEETNLKCIKNYLVLSCLYVPAARYKELLAVDILAKLGAADNLDRLEAVWVLCRFGALGYN